MAWIPQRDQWTGPACIENEEMILRISKFLSWDFMEALPVIFWVVLTAIEGVVYYAAPGMGFTVLLALELIVLPLASYLLAGFATLAKARRLIASGALEELAVTPIEPGAIICAMSLQPMQILTLSRCSALFVLGVVFPVGDFLAGNSMQLTTSPLIVFHLFLRLGILNRIEAIASAFARRIALCGEWEVPSLRLIAESMTMIGNARINLMAAFFIVILIMFAGIMGILLVLLFLPFYVFLLRRSFTEAAERCNWWIVETAPYWRLRAREESEASPPGGLWGFWPESEELLLRLYQQSENEVIPRWLRPPENR